MKWTDEQVETLRKLCFEEKSNAEIAETLGCETKDIHSKRSQLGITREKVKAAKAQDTQQKYIDNRPELKARLRKDYNLSAWVIPQRHNTGRACVAWCDSDCFTCWE